MNFKTTLTKFLTNKWVLNIVAFLALLNVIGYIVIGNLNSAMFFIIVAVLVRYFSKNMIIVLGIPLILVNLMSVKGNFTEGLENNSPTSQSSSSTNNSNTNASDKKPDAQSKVTKKVNQQDAKTKQGLPVTPLDDTVKTTNTNNSSAVNDESFEVGRGKKKSYDIDYASTVEDAYDELNKILGSDGIKRLTDDTQGLMKQQMQLAESMKSMAPLIQGMAPMMKQAQEMLSGMGEGGQGLSGIMDMAKKLTNGMNQ
jgi:hypothetical protein